jgi:hypothetical protein
MTYTEQARQEWGGMVTFWLNGWHDYEGGRYVIPRSYSERAAQAYKAGYKARGDISRGWGRMLTENQ